MKLSRSVGEVVESSDLDKLQCKNETMETTSDRDPIRKKNILFDCTHFRCIVAFNYPLWLSGDPIPRTSRPNSRHRATDIIRGINEIIDAHHYQYYIL